MPSYLSGRPRADDSPSGQRRLVTALYKPGHRLFQLAFEADITKAPLSRLWETLSRRGIALVSLTVTDITNAGGKWNVFLDCDDYAITAEGLVHILEGMEFLRDLEVAGGGELIVDDLYFPIITTTGGRTMLMGQDVLQRMLSAMSEQFGTGGNLISYQQGVAMGSLAAGELQAAVKSDLRSFILDAVKMYSANGIGRAKFVMADLDAMHFVIAISHNIECEGKKTKVPNSEWIRGHLAGSASTVLGVPMGCTERRCMAMGDPCCEFELTKQDV